MIDRLVRSALFFTVFDTLMILSCLAEDNSPRFYCETTECPDTYFCTKINLCVTCSSICIESKKPKPTFSCNTLCPGFLEHYYGNYITATEYPVGSNTTNPSSTVEQHGPTSDINPPHSHYGHSSHVLDTLNLVVVIAVVLVIILIIVGFIRFRRKHKRNKLKKKKLKDVESGLKDSDLERESFIQYQSQSEIKLEEIEVDNEVINAVELDDLAMEGKLVEDESIGEISDDNNSLGINLREKYKHACTVKNQTAIPLTLDSFSLEDNTREHTGVVSENPQVDLEAIAVESSPQGSQPILVQADIHVIPSQSSRLLEVESSGTQCDLPPIPPHASLLSNPLTLNDGFTPEKCTSSGFGTGPNVFVINVGQVPLNDNAMRALDNNIAQPASNEAPHVNNAQASSTVAAHGNNIAQLASNVPPHVNMGVRRPIEHGMDNTHSITSNCRHADHIDQCTSRGAVEHTSTTTQALQDTGSIPQHVTSTRQPVVITTGSDDEMPNQTARAETMTETNPRSVTTDAEQETDTVPKEHMPLLNSLGKVEINNGSDKDLLNLDANKDSNTPYPLLDHGSIPAEVMPTPNNKARSMTPEPQQSNI